MMGCSKMLDETNSAEEIRRGAPSIAVWGIGAIEQHSLHLPLGTDWLIGAELARRVAEELGALLVPALPFSMSQCHGAMAGTVWLKPATLAAVVRDVVLSLYEGGVRRVLLINAHGGNFVLEAELQRLNSEHRDLIVLLAPPWMALPNEGGLWETAPGVHAEEKETSCMLYLHPEWVKAARCDYQPPVGREFLDYTFLGGISEQGVWGCASAGTAAKGEAAVSQAVAYTVRWAREAFGRIAALRAEAQHGA